MKFEFFQIEITRKCVANCIMCPRNLGQESFKKEMKFEVFEELSKYFKHAKIVHLQGWGEPMLHEKFFQMIEIAKENCMVGFTTNGMLLNGDKIRKLSDLSIDYVAISIAGATPKTHESVRRGTSFEKIMKNVKELLRFKNKMKVILTFLVNKLNVHELLDVVKLASKLKVDELVVTNLDYVFNEYTDELKIFSCKKPEKEYVKVLENAKKVAKEEKVIFRTHPQQLEDRVVCDAIPTKSVTISAEGNLYPCVYLNLPFKKIPRIFCGKYLEVEKPDFGSIFEFWKSWNSKNYVEFRNMYERRIKEYTAIFSDAFISPYSLSSKIKMVLERNPVPEVCKTCYKAYGI